MARAGVNFVQVSKAAEALAAKGITPTIERIRQELGTGSSSTLAPLLKQWKIRNEDIANTEGLPTDLIEAVKSVYERVQSAAELKIGTIEAEKDSIISNLRAALNDATTLGAQLKSQHRQLEVKVQSLMKESEVLRSSELVLRTQDADNKDRLIQLKAANEELKHENRTIREQAEHYQQHMIQDRQQEREQFRFTTQQLQNQLEQTHQQYQKLEIQHDALSEEKKNLLSMVEQFRFELNNEQQLFIRQKTEYLTLKAVHQETQSQLQAAKEKIENLHVSNSHLNSQLALFQAENSVLKTAVDNQENQLAIQVNTISQLTDEHNVTLQEKAMLLGQLKQLQQSL